MLHIVNKSPWERNALDSLLRIAHTGSVLLIEDGVYAATRGSVSEARVREAMTRLTLYVLRPDAEARAVADRIIEGVTPVDYGGFVDLVTTHRNCQSWL